jgi:hypothetical protein
VTSAIRNWGTRIRTYPRSAKSLTKPVDSGGGCTVKRTPDKGADAALDEVLSSWDQLPYPVRDAVLAVVRAGRQVVLAK